MVANDASKASLLNKALVSIYSTTLKQLKQFKLFLKTGKKRRKCDSSYGYNKTLGNCDCSANGKQLLKILVEYVLSFVRSIFRWFY